MVVDMDRTNACWGVGIEDIARLQCEELGDIGDNLIDTIKHVAGTTFLNGLAIDIQMEMNSLYIQELLLWVFEKIVLAFLHLFYCYIYALP